MPSFRDLDGNWVLWNGKLADLGPAYIIDSVTDGEPIVIYEGNDLDLGLYKFFIGIRTQGIGKPILYNAKALRLEVVE